MKLERINRVQREVGAFATSNHSRQPHADISNSTRGLNCILPILSSTISPCLKNARPSLSSSSLVCLPKPPCCIMGRKLTIVPFAAGMSSSSSHNADASAFQCSTIRNLQDRGQLDLYKLIILLAPQASMPASRTQISKSRPIPQIRSKSSHSFLRTKHCWQNYVDYHKCILAKGEDFAPCRQVRFPFPNLFGVAPSLT